MTKIVPFNDDSNLPAYLSGVDTNNDLLAHASTSFPMLSIKGKQFTLIRGGESTPLMSVRDPSAPASYVDVVIVKASPYKSKTYYATGFHEGSTDNKPTCFSSDGERPDPSVESPQCKNCKACKWNVFGSSTTGKGKACSDFVRVAIATPDAIEDAILLRVPPASIKSLGEFGSILAKRKIPYQATLTRISFDMAQATPRLLFKPVGILPEATYRAAIEVSESDLVHRITMGTGETTDDESGYIPIQPVQKVATKPASAPAPKNSFAAAEEIEEVEEVVEAPITRKTKETPAPVGKAEVTAEAIIAEAIGGEDNSLGDVLSDLDFDD